MSDIKLSYFNARGRAETARLILAHAGVRYIDQRLTEDVENFAVAISAVARINVGDFAYNLFNSEALLYALFGGLCRPPAPAQSAAPR